jgi:hypothetical protein
MVRRVRAAIRSSMGSAPRVLGCVAVGACAQPRTTPRDGAATDGAPPVAWACPAEWVPLSVGGCGPAVLVCGAGGGATPVACADAASGTAERAFVREANGTIAGRWPGGSAATTARADCPPAWRRDDDGACVPALRADCPVGAEDRKSVV